MKYKISQRGQFNELKNKIKKQKEYFTKKIKTTKENQADILELKNSINEMTMENRADQMEKIIGELEMSQVKEKRELRVKK